MHTQLQPKTETVGKNLKIAKGEVLIAQEQLRDENLRHGDHQLLPRALLVLHSGFLRLRPIGPEHMGKELLPLGTHEAARKKLARSLEYLGIMHHKWLEPIQHLSLLHLEGILVILQNEVALGFTVLVGHWGLEAEAFVDHGSQQRHVLERPQGDDPTGGGHGFRHLVVEFVHQLGASKLVEEARDLREEDVEPTIGVEAEEEEQVGSGLVAVDPQLLGHVQRFLAICLEPVEKSVVLVLHQQRRDGHGAKRGLLHGVWQARVPNDRGQLRQGPSRRVGPAVLTQARWPRRRRVLVTDRAQEEIECELLHFRRQTRLLPVRQIGFPLHTRLLKASVKLWNEVLPVARQKVEAPLLQLRVLLLAGVQVRAHTEPGIEFCARHVRPHEHILLLHLAYVEQHREALLIQEADDSGVIRDGRPRRHVDTEHRAFVLVHSALVKLVLPLKPEIVKPILDSTAEWQSIVSRNRNQRPSRSLRLGSCHSHTLDQINNLSPISIKDNAADTQTPLFTLFYPTVSENLETLQHITSTSSLNF
ncbi:hypothetical protein M758_8G052000 [Ceratodon purpureus]|nr:hypothetical protein M758_8G052000 [Ceratodon purpureus]